MLFAPNPIFLHPYLMAALQTLSMLITESITIVLEIITKVKKYILDQLQPICSCLFCKPKLCHSSNHQPIDQLTEQYLKLANLLLIEGSQAQHIAQWPQGASFKCDANFCSQSLYCVKGGGGGGGGGSGLN